MEEDYVIEMCEVSQVRYAPIDYAALSKDSAAGYSAELPQPSICMTKISLQKLASSTTVVYSPNSTRSSHDSMGFIPLQKEDDDLFEDNEKVQMYVPVVPLQADLLAALPVENVLNIRNAFNSVLSDMKKVNDRSAFTEWPAIIYDSVGREVLQGVDRVNYPEVYHRYVISVTNPYLHEYYAYMRWHREHYGVSEFWSKMWMSFKFMLAFYNYDYTDMNKCKRLLYWCEDIYFQQYINLVSLVYKWNRVFSYPYMEIMGNSYDDCDSVITFMPVFDDNLLSENAGCDARIYTSYGVGMHVDVSVFKKLLTAKELLQLLFVSKGFYVSLYLELLPFRQYQKYLGKYAFGMGFITRQPIRKFFNATYAGSVFSRGHARDYAVEEYRVVRNTNAYETFELNEAASSVALSTYAQGYDCPIRVGSDMFNWLRSLMAIVPYTYRKSYSRLPCLTAGHFAIFFSSCAPESKIRNFSSRFIHFYNKDYLFHLFSPFVVGANSWCWEPGIVRGREWSRNFN